MLPCKNYSRKKNKQLTQISGLICLFWLGVAWVQKPERRLLNKILNFSLLTFYQKTLSSAFTHKKSNNTQQTSAIYSDSSMPAPEPAAACSHSQKLHKSKYLKKTIFLLVFLPFFTCLQEWRWSCWAKEINWLSFFHSLVFWKGIKVIWA